jgi:hypothetical protein
VRTPCTSPRRSTTRCSFCVADATDLVALCQPRVIWVALHGLPPGVVFPTFKLELAGKPLHVPAGCRQVGQERIACPEASLNFREGNYKKDALEAAEMAYASAGLKVTSRRPLACTIAGRAARGIVVELASPRAPLTVTTCTMRTGELTSTAACEGPAPDSKGHFPRPCDQLLGTVVAGKADGKR